jgi:LuxR family quorum sensing-dependent transcriptional regulator
MALVNLAQPAQPSSLTNLQTDLAGFADSVCELRSPNDVLDALHGITTRHLPLPVMGAARLPLRSGEWSSIRIGRTVFLHRSVPQEWWQEYETLAGARFRPIMYLAASSMAMHTWGEVRRMLQPIGIDKWIYDLALKHGMRDGLSCPVGGRWVVGFWSRRDLANIVTRPVKIMLCGAASFAALRLEQIVDADPKRIGAHVRLTPRELAVLRLVSTGVQFREVAQELELGEETIRSHLKKAQSKLGARNRTQAVAEAMRRNLIP